MILNASSYCAHHEISYTSLKDYDDLYEPKIQKKLRLPEIENEVAKIAVLYTKAVKKFGFFVNRFYLADTICKLKDRNFFTNKKLEQFQQKLYESNPKVDDLCQKAFAEFKNIADLHIAGALTREIREKVSKEVYPKNALNFRVQRDVYISQGVLPETPALTLKEVDEFEKIKKLQDKKKKHLYLISLIFRLKECENSPNIQKFDQELGKRNDQLCTFFKMSQMELGIAFNGLNKAFTTKCASRIIPIIAIKTQA